MIESTVTVAPMLKILSASEDAVLAGWVASLRATGLASSNNSEVELRRDCGEALRAVMAALRGDDLSGSLPTATRFARIQLDGGVAQSDMVVRLIQGRQAMVEVLRRDLPAELFSDCIGRLNEAVTGVISLYGNATCSVCMTRQDDRRMLVERRLESVIDRSQDGIVLMDPDGLVQSWNPGAEALFGYTEAEMRGRNLDVITPAARLQDGEVAQLLREVTRNGYGRLPETERQRKGGGSVWVDVGYTAVGDGAQHESGMWAIFRDITQSRLLHEAKLQSERLALIGTMSAKLAHEVRNPLTSIVLNLDLIQDSLARLPEDDAPHSRENREMLAAIESEVQRINRVVEDYLRFARLPRLRLEALEMDSFLSRHLAILEPETAQRRIKLKLDLGCPGLQVQADEEQLWQALLNLIRNAMEAMPEGGQLNVVTRESGDCLECRVEDVGPGIPEELRAKIFQPFFSTKLGGTGLGLPLTQQIFKEHGARLVCESRVGEGTVFRALLPLVRGGVAAGPAIRLTPPPTP